ncbi:unnamed protein product [Paramecium primaurelia]|uniref:Uncharacterized protein n=2 Tax=Paramecium TaxID=5884 RepID=A0A8S1U377_9CILI|nr:unnamed protein product [Paramecium primaurelia]CAD8159625.1 unnamed protein product [Paramecium pentaurelia]
MQYPNYFFKPSNDVYIKRKQAAMKMNFGKNIWAAISIAFSCYYLFGLYRDWLIELPFWQKWRQEKITAKESYEFVIQGFHPIRKTLIQQFSQF